MKGNNGAGNIIERDIWETPENLWVALNSQYNFFFDCSANKNNRKTFSFTSDFEKWNNIDNVICWMNPPFSKAKRMFKHFFKVVNYGVAIYRCDNLESRLWQEVILKHADWVFIPKGRVNYKGMSGKGSRFPSALIGVGLPEPKNIAGRTLIINNSRVVLS